MSFFRRIITSVTEVVQDDFPSKLQLHDVMTVINRQRQFRGSSDFQGRSASISPQQLFKQIDGISEFTPQIEFRMLGYEPSVEGIDARVRELKNKLAMVEEYLMQNSQEYLRSINRSLGELPSQKDFYAGRIHSQELRNIVGKLRQALDYSRRITLLNIRMKNLKSTLKILEKIPNIKKMNLIELKTINKESLAQLSQDLLPLSQSGRPLLCIDNLFSYITKVNNEEFIFIIDKIKLCLEQYEGGVYEEVIRNYIVIAPGTPLEKLLVSLLEEKIRLFLQVNVERVEGITKIGKRVVGLMTNLHKIIKWHRNNKAVRLKHNSNENKRMHRLSVDSTFLSGLPEEQIRNRCLSIDSVYSDEGQLSIQINQSVVIDPSALKGAFSRTIDSCLSDLASDYILTEEVDFCRLHECTYLLSKISEVCFNFTGLTFDRLRRVILEHLSRREYDLYARNAKELVSVLELERNQWNRLPFDNRYRHKGLDKLIFAFERMSQREDFKKVVSCVDKLFHPRERDISEIKKILEEEDSDGDQVTDLQFSHSKLPALDKGSREFQGWQPEQNYLGFSQGDAILCQSSFKLLSIMEKHFEFLTLVPRVDCLHLYLSRLLLFTEYYTFYLFMAFLSNTYKAIFFQPYNPAASIDKKYLKKRLAHLYPRLSAFVVGFRAALDEGRPDSKWYSFFRKQIKGVQSDDTQVLRAKVVATEACRYVMAYVHEIVVRMAPKTDEEGRKVLLERLEDGKSVLRELSTILLTESSQKMVGLELETMKSLFQTIRWRDSFSDLKEYMSKFSSLIRESFDRLRSSNRGQIPLSLVQRISVLIWRTLLTYSIKLFLENKSNFSRQAKLNFQKFIDEMHVNFADPDNREFAELTSAYETFKGIFGVLFSEEWGECRERLMDIVRRKEYIYAIVTALLENAECLREAGERDKELCRRELREEIEEMLAGS